MFFGSSWLLCRPQGQNKALDVDILTILVNVRGEPVFSVMAAGWFCEKYSWIGKVEDVKLVLFKKKFKKKRILTGNHFEEDFYPDELWNRRISSDFIHLGLDIIWF
jgi:hypothetical protein